MRSAAKDFFEYLEAVRDGLQRGLPAVTMIEYTLPMDRRVVLARCADLTCRIRGQKCLEEMKVAATGIRDQVGRAECIVITYVRHDDVLIGCLKDRKWKEFMVSPREYLPGKIEPPVIRRIRLYKTLDVVLAGEPESTEEDPFTPLFNDFLQ